MNLTHKILMIANECNCRASHGAAGAVHLFEIEKMLKEALADHEAEQKAIMANAARKAYLGDSVYAHFDGHNIWLTTDNGAGPSNIVIIDPQVLQNLKAYVENLKLEFP